MGRSYKCLETVLALTHTARRCLGPTCQHVFGMRALPAARLQLQYPAARRCLMRFLGHTCRQHLLPVLQAVDILGLLAEVGQAVATLGLLAEMGQAVDILGLLAEVVVGLAEVVVGLAVVVVGGLAEVVVGLAEVVVGLAAALVHFLAASLVFLLPLVLLLVEVGLT